MSEHRGYSSEGTPQGGFVPLNPGSRGRSPSHVRVSPSPMPGGNHSSGDDKSRSHRGIWRVVFWVAAIICVISLAALAFIAWTYWSADRNYKDIASHAFTVPSDEAGTSLGDMTVDWDYLRSINPDVVAWVYIPGTPVNYPVAHTDNNETYLSTDFDGASGPNARCGSIFLDSTNLGTFSDTNNVLYGHHMNDGSMFACLSTELTDNAAFNSHRTVYILTPRANYKCTSFALIRTDGSDPLVETWFKDAAARTNYVQDKENRSVVTPDEGMPDASSITKFFTLSTCDYSETNGRAVLFAQMVDSAVPQTSGAGSLVDPSDAAAVSEAAKEAA